jgi:hypothetical protein
MMDGQSISMLLFQIKERSWITKKRRVVIKSGRQSIRVPSSLMVKRRERD